MKTKYLSEKRYLIIKPFLNGEKKLKEIEKDSKISYATLKRWVKSYKENGQVGLEKKVRKDIKKHRNISDETAKFLKETYFQNPGIKVSTLYKKYSEFITDIKEESVSYNTIYRLIRSLDLFVQPHAEMHFKRSQKKHQSYRISSFKLKIGVLDPFSYKVLFPYLYICYDLSTLEVLNYRISTAEFSLDDTLFLLRETILKVQLPEESNFLPHELIIDFFNLKNEKKLSLIKKNLNIYIKNSFTKIPDIENFLNFLSDDIIKLQNNPNEYLDFNTLDKLIYSYIYMKNKTVPISYSLEDKRSKFNEKLDILLEKKPRKIQEYGIRFKNTIYKNIKFKDFISKTVEIRYDPYDLEKIYVYYEGDFLCIAHSI